MVAGVAIGVQAFLLSASRLWVATDSGGYIKLAAAVVERLDFAHEYFQFRPPGYPVLLASVFRVFGSASPTAILVLQHALVAGTAVLATLIAWALWPHRGFAWLVGLCGAFSLHLSTYANTVMTEVPYAFGVTACVYLLLRYGTTGRWPWLVGASAAAGGCALIKAFGQCMPLLCVLTALAYAGSGLRRRACHAVLAGIPAAILLVPVMANNYRTSGYFQLSCNGGLALYHRAVVIENLGGGTSVSMDRIRECVAEARHRGLVRDWVEVPDVFWVKDAIRGVQGVSMAAAADLMGQAGCDLLREHLGAAMLHSVRHAWRTLVMPDTYYRVVPGYTPADMLEVQQDYGAIVLVAGAEFMAKYLPPEFRPTITSPHLAVVTRWYRQYVDGAWREHGWVRSPYEALAVMSVLGGLAAFTRKNWRLWLIAGAVVFAHVVVAAYLGGTSPRYAVPVHPLLQVFGALALVLAGRLAVRAGRRVVGFHAESLASTTSVRPGDAASTPQWQA